MNGIRNLILAVVLAALTTSTASADSHDPALQAVEAWESIEWFTSNCEAGTLPEIPMHNLSLKVEGKGEIARWSGTRHLLKLFPGRVYSPGHPVDAAILNEDRTLGYGVYCVHVEVIKEAVEVKLVCDAKYGHGYTCDETRQLEVDLSVGYNVVRVDDDSMAAGRYQAWFRCPNGQRLCLPARASGSRFVPPTEHDICQYLTAGKWC